MRNSASVQATSPVGVTTALADEDLEIERESSLTVGKPHDGCHDMLNLKSRAAGGAADCIWVEDTPWVAAGLNFSAGRAFVKVPMKRTVTPRVLTYHGVKSMGKPFTHPLWFFSTNNSINGELSPTPDYALKRLRRPHPINDPVEPIFQSRPGRSTLAQTALLPPGTPFRTCLKSRTSGIPAWP